MLLLKSIGFAAVSILLIVRTAFYQTCLVFTFNIILIFYILLNLKTTGARKVRNLLGKRVSSQYALTSAALEISNNVVFYFTLLCWILVNFCRLVTSVFWSNLKAYYIIFFRILLFFIPNKSYVHKPFRM